MWKNHSELQTGAAFLSSCLGTVFALAKGLNEPHVVVYA